MREQDSISRPLPVIPLEYAPPVSRTTRMARVARIMTAVCWASSAVALGTIFAIDVESVVVSGPILLLIGGYTITAGWRARLWRVLVLGASLCAVCLLFIMLVNVLNWSPTKADAPFKLMGATYIAATAVPTLLVFISRDPANTP